MLYTFFKGLYQYLFTEYHFLTFLIEWEKGTKKMQFNFITKQTCYSLKVSLKALEMCSFLNNECGIQYLMTSRLNQDSLAVNLSFSKCK